MGSHPSDDESDDFSWSDDEPENGNPPGDSASAVCNRGGGNTSAFCEASSSSGPSNSLFRHFVAMGFCDKMVTRALEESENVNAESILETLLTYTALENSPTRNKDAESAPTKVPDVDSDLQIDYDSDFMSSDDEENLLDDSDSCPEVQNSLLSPSESSKLSKLVDMDFPMEEALLAIERCGPNASVEELANFILAAQIARADDPYYVDPPAKEMKLKKRKMGYVMLGSKRQRGCDDEEAVYLPKPMIGFGVPTMSCNTACTRELPESALGPPYFYYENVALAPKGVWDVISRFLYEVKPEFVDSKYFCAAARKRGYIHNLPIKNRFPILPLPPQTIHDALPLTKRWWPVWDKRTKLNCLQTAYGSAQLTNRIREKLLEWPGEEPPLHVQKYVLEECRRWNLVWVGRNKVATLEPDEVEMLLGFPRNYTRGVSRTDRYKSLGNSFQVDTVAYHLSVLKELFPDGIRVLSLFTGIGGGEVALHRLGIRLKVVVSVEISEVNQSIVQSWWDQTNQTGTLIHMRDVQQVDKNNLEELITKFGGFDFVMGGSPCNNLAGGNRVSRDGLEGEHSSLFYDYFRILDLVKCIMDKKQ